MITRDVRLFVRQHLSTACVRARLWMISVCVLVCVCVSGSCGACAWLDGVMAMTTLVSNTRGT